MENRIKIVKGLLENSDACFEIEDDLIWSYARDIVDFDDLNIAFKELLNKDFHWKEIQECAGKMNWCFDNENHISSNECYRGITIENFIELMDALNVA